MKETAMGHQSKIGQSWIPSTADMSTYLCKALLNPTCKSAGNPIMPTQLQSVLQNIMTYQHP